MTKRADWRAHFWPPTVAWFDSTFTGPTPVQIATWMALADRPATPSRNPGGALVIAPTGSGKTLAAFLVSIDRLARSMPAGRPSVLYVSPLKALAVDIERNLAQPLAGIRRAADEMGLVMPDIRVGLRSGDTLPSERRRLVADPPDILITTPESLFLMLSSKAAETLTGLETVIVDEIHYLAGTKRGAHLAVSLERLDARRRAAGRPPLRRVGLSATVRPPDAVAQFLGGDPVRVINPVAPKEWALDVRVPVDDMAALPPPPNRPEAANRSIWPFIDEAILDLVMAHRSTICFVNSRMVAERLTAHLNQLAAERAGIERTVDDMPSVYAATHGIVLDFGPVDGAPIVARAHHGSLSKEHRTEVEEALKAGRLRCVVATSSLELGIDMGFVDLVVQAGSPPSVASGLQRVGRAGHQVGMTSHGVVFPTSRPDLLEAAVVTSRMGDGLIEAVPTLANPLDVLAQQVISMCLDARPTPDEAFDIVRRAQPFAGLPRAAFDAVVDMAAGRYPSDDFVGLRPRLAIDEAGRLAALPGSRQLVTISGGTIPDRGLFGVFLVGGDDQRHGARRVGELDEEMVNETRLGDVVTLGSSSWRVVAITPHQVQVVPAPGTAGRLPFWHGESIGRPVELGKAIGAFIQSVGDAPGKTAEALTADGLDARAVTNLVTYIADQKRATGVLPSDRAIVFERFRDDLGDWRVCVHAPFGLPVLRPWMLAVHPNLAARYGTDVKVSLRNDGVIWRVPASDAPPPSAALLAVPPTVVDDIVRAELTGSSLFAAHFRECAARALLLPRRRPGSRTPLWAQRLRAGQLLEVASGYKDFPIVVEAMRECLDDVFDMPGLRALLTDIVADRVRLVEVETASPSPFARSLQFGYAAEFIYDADQPLAERRSAAIDIDPGLLDGLLGAPDGPADAKPGSKAVREAARPVGSDHLASFMLDWQGVNGPEPGLDSLLRAVDQLAGWPLPASMLETLILPSRVSDYQSALLDEALVTGQVIWTGGGTIGEHDAWVRLWPADAMLATTPTESLDDDQTAAAALARLRGGGAWRLTDLGADTPATQAALWRLAWAGLVTTDSFAPVRDFCRATRRRAPMLRRVHSWRGSRPFVPGLAGRWLAVDAVEDTDVRTVQAVAAAMRRHGIATRGVWQAESVDYSTARQVLAVMEARGQVTRGYYIAHAGATQYALSGTVDRLRRTPSDEPVVLAAIDPVNPYGLAVDWPAATAYQPARRAGAVVVLVGGRPACFLERGAKTLITFVDTPDDDLLLGLQAIGQAVDDERLGTCSLTRIDDQPAIGWAKTGYLQTAGFRPTPQGFTRRPHTMV